MNRDFRSDNTLPCSPEILEAIDRAGRASASPYGEDEITARLRARCREVFETDVAVFPLATGTAGNGLAIASMTPRWGAVFCHEHAHVHRDEMSAPEFFIGGGKMVPLPGADGKLTAETLLRAIEDVGGSGRMAVPSCVSLSQATEAGTIYRSSELEAIGAAARAAGAGVHMDGARFTNALVSSGRTPAELTWRSGVDILILGATKNGALAAEAMLVFRPELAKDLAIRIHRAGHRVSKMRHLSAQLDAWLADDLWLRNAKRANDAARRLEAGLATIPGVEVLRPVEANVVFVHFPGRMATALREAGFSFYEWPLFGEDAFRLVCGFNRQDEEVDALVDQAREASAAPA